MSAVRQTLVAARELLSNPQRWTQDAFAKDTDGNEVLVKSPSACSFCMSGALDAVQSDVDVKERAWVILAAVTGYGSVAGFNDEPGRTHEEVLVAFDKAIARCSDL